MRSIKSLGKLKLQIIQILEEGMTGKEVVEKYGNLISSQEVPQTCKDYEIGSVSSTISKLIKENILTKESSKGNLIFTEKGKFIKSVVDKVDPQILFSKRASSRAVTSRDVRILDFCKDTPKSIEEISYRIGSTSGLERAVERLSTTGFIEIKSERYVTSEVGKKLLYALK